MCNLSEGIIKENTDTIIANLIRNTQLLDNEIAKSCNVSIEYVQRIRDRISSSKKDK